MTTPTKSAAPIPEWLDIGALAAVDTSEQAWLRSIGCAGVDAQVFMPHVERGENYDYTKARGWCSNCPVALECLARWLVDTSSSTDGGSGIYVGNTTPVQRKAIRRALRAAVR